VLLLHGIDNDGGYSPLSSQILRESVQYLDARRNAFWVETFGNVVRYIKERNDVTVVETSVQPASITLRISDTLDDDIYSYPVTLRRPLPAGWTSATVSQNDQPVPSSLVTVNSVTYVMFDAVPDKGLVELASPGAAQGPLAPAGLTASAGDAMVSLDWNDNSESDLSGYNVYRSTMSGRGYTLKGSVLAGNSAYADTSVTNGTSYYYVVTAFNAGGSESPYSNEASARPGGSAATSLHVESIVVDTIAAGGPNKKGRATVVVKDNNGSPVANATVTGTFLGTLNETRSGTTDSTGTVVIQTNSFQKTITTLQFCVENVAHALLAYRADANLEKCDAWVR
jgi:hypothetical protein